MNSVMPLNFSKSLFSVCGLAILTVASFGLQFSPTHVQAFQRNYNEVATLGRGIIFGASWRPDGQALVVNTNLGAWIYTAAFEDITRFENVRLAAFSPSGNILVAAKSDRNELLIWDAESYELVKTIEVQPELPQIEAIALSPDGTQVAVGVENNVEVFDVNSVQSVLSLSVESPIASLTWKPDGQRLAVGRVSYVDILDLQQSRIRNTLQIDSGKPIARWSPDNQTLATLGAYFDGAGAIGNTLKVWDDDGLNLRLVIQAPYTRTFAWSPDGTILAGEYYDDIGYPIHSLSFWDARTGEVLPLGVPDGYYREPVLAVEWSPDGTQLMTALRDNTVRLYNWPLTSEQIPRILPGHSGSVTAISWNPDGKQLASASEDSGARIWEVASQQQVARFQATTSQLPEVFAVTWNPNGEQIALGTNGSTITVLDVTTGEEIVNLVGHELVMGTYEPTLSGIADLAWSPSGTSIASGGYDGTARLWDSSTGSLLNTFDESGIAVLAVDWSADSKRLAYTALTAKVWNVNQNTVSLTCQDDGVIYTIALSPDGQFLAGTSSNYGVCIWNVDENRLLTRLNVYAVKLDWSPDGTKLAAIVTNNETNERTFEIWDTSSWETVAMIDMQSELTAIAWSPDGRQIAVGDAEGIIRICEEEG